MNDKQIQRLNELAKIKKEKGLTPEEAREQQNLYSLFIKNIRGQVTTQLDQAGYSKKQQDCQCGCQDAKGFVIPHLHGKNK